jgi:hypothetical protein
VVVDITLEAKSFLGMDQRVVECQVVLDDPFLDMDLWLVECPLQLEEGLTGRWDISVVVGVHPCHKDQGVVVVRWCLFEWEGDQWVVEGRRWRWFYWEEDPLVVVAFSSEKDPLVVMGFYWEEDPWVGLARWLDCLESEEDRPVAVDRLFYWEEDRLLVVVRWLDWL